MLSSQVKALEDAGAKVEVFELGEKTPDILCDCMLRLAGYFLSIWSRPSHTKSEYHDLEAAFKNSKDDFIRSQRRIALGAYGKAPTIMSIITKREEYVE